MPLILTSKSTKLYYYNTVLLGRNRCLLDNVLDLSNSDLLVIANSIDAADSSNESVEA